MAMTMEELVAKFVAVRDHIDATTELQKEALAPFKKIKEDLGALILNKLQAQGADSVATPSGTAYVSTKRSATIADGEAFWDYVVGQKAWDLVDKKANAPAVEDFINEHKIMPPGINFTKIQTLGVRRK